MADAYASVTATAGTSNPLTCTSNGRVAYFGYTRYIRANLSAFSGGTSPTLTAWLIAIPTSQLASFPGSNAVGAAPTANQVLSTDGTTNDWRTLAFGTTGTDLNLAYAADSITIHVPDASATARGVVNATTQTFAGVKTFDNDIGVGRAPASSRLEAATSVAKATTASTTVMRLGSSDAAATAQEFFVQIRGETTAGNRGAIVQSFEQGTGARSLWLQPLGGNTAVGIAETTIPTAALQVGGTTLATKFLTTENCADGTATPADCSGAPSGAVIISAAATAVTVNTTAVTADSQIIITEDSSLGTRLSVTCNTTIARNYAVTARTAATSFVITTDVAPVTNPACLNFWIVN